MPAVVRRRSDATGPRDCGSVAARSLDSRGGRSTSILRSAILLQGNGPPMRHEVFVAGGTGYIGSRLVPLLLSRGHRVRALARPGSERRLPPGCEVVSG